MKNLIKRLTAAVLVTAMLLSMGGVAFAAPPASITALTSGSAGALFEGTTNGSSYTDIAINTYTADGKVCYGMNYPATVPTSATTYNRDSTTDAELVRMLKYGYPLQKPTSAEMLSKFKGITEAQMKYATAAAVYALYAQKSGAPDSVFKAYNSNNSYIRAKSGNEIALNYFKWLLARAKDAQGYTPQITSASGMEMDILLDSDHVFKGDLPITVSKCTEPYTWTTNPTTVSAAAVGSFDTENQIHHNVTMPFSAYIEGEQRSITFTADDYAKYAEIDSYTNTNAANSPIVRVAAGQKETVDVKVNIIAVAKSNKPFYITKTDANDGLPVAGAEISIYKTASDIFVKKGLTNNLGLYEVRDLSPGQYYFKETKEPPGYEPNSNKNNFTISESGELQPGSKTTFTNRRKNLTNIPFDIAKTNSVTGAPVAGAHIAVYDSSNTMVLRNVTDASGNMRVEGLLPGVYTYEEVMAPTGYELNPNMFSFTVSRTGEVEGDKTLPNTPSGSIPIPTPGGMGISEPFYIEKTDLNTGAFLSGAFFRVYDSNSNVVKEGETGTNGRLLIDKLPVGSYTIYEEIPPSGYQKNSQGVTITVLASGSVRGVTNGVLPITNAPANTIPTNPTTANTGNCIQVYQKGTTTPVQGVTLTFTGGNSGSGWNSVGNGGNYTAITDANGRAYFASLANGQYSYKVTQVPNTYACSTESYTMQKTGPNTATGTLIIYVDFVLLGFKKVDSKDTNKALSGAKFTLYDASYNEVSSVTTGNDGMAHFTKLNPGKYSVKEVTAPKGYTPSNDVWNFEITNTYVNTAATVVKNSGSVKTGVFERYSLIFVAALAVAVIVCVLLGSERRRKKKTQENKQE